MRDIKQYLLIISFIVLLSLLASQGLASTIPSERDKVIEETVLLLAQNKEPVAQKPVVQKIEPAVIERKEPNPNPPPRNFTPPPLPVRGPKFRYSLSIFEEYDTNVFLVGSRRTNDLKTIIRPKASIEVPQGDLFFRVGSQAEITRFPRFGEQVESYKANTFLSYSGAGRFSFSLSDKYTKATESTIPTQVSWFSTTFSDRLLRLGFHTNNLETGAKFRLTDKLTAGANYGFDYIDFEDEYLDDTVDRRTHYGVFTLGYQFTPWLDLYGGYKRKFVDYNEEEFSMRDSMSNFIVWGGKLRVANAVRLFCDASYEWKNFRGTSYPLYAGDVHDNEDVNVRAGFSTIISRYTTLSCEYIHAMADTGRTDFLQYHKDKVSGKLKHYITPKTILFLTASLEWQEYHDDEERVFGTPPGWNWNATTWAWEGGWPTAENLWVRTGTFDIAIRRILNKWAWLEVGYRYSGRRSMFPSEDYVDSRTRVGITCSF